MTAEEVPVRVREVIDAALPLLIGAVESNEPFFSVFAEEPRWFLGVACPWRLRGPSFDYDSEEIAIEDFDRIVAILAGQTIQTIDLKEDLADPVFHFAGGLTLELLADTDVDPWVLSLPGASVIIVGRAPHGGR